MYKIEITGFETKEQAEGFAQWYSENGKDHCSNTISCYAEGVKELFYATAFQPVKSAWCNDTLKMEFVVIKNDE